MVKVPDDEMVKGELHQLFELLSMAG